MGAYFITSSRRRGIKAKAEGDGTFWVRARAQIPDSYFARLFRRLFIPGADLSHEEFAESVRWLIKVASYTYFGLPRKHSRPILRSDTQDTHCSQTCWGSTRGPSENVVSVRLTWRGFSAQLRVSWVSQPNQTVADSESPKVLTTRGLCLVSARAFCLHIAAISYLPLSQALSLP